MIDRLNSQTNFDESEMEELIIKNKQEYLNDNYPFADTPKLTDKQRCIHCDSVFTVGDYKVFKDKNGIEFICCPNATDCNGTLIDWFSVD
jgi:hypothetical protein